MSCPRGYTRRPGDHRLTYAPGAGQISTRPLCRGPAPHPRKGFFPFPEFLSSVVASVQNDRYGTTRRSIAIAETASKFGSSRKDIVAEFVRHAASTALKCWHLVRECGQSSRRLIFSIEHQARSTTLPRLASRYVVDDALARRGVKSRQSLRADRRPPAKQYGEFRYFFWGAATYPQDEDSLGCRDPSRTRH
jgi:hypothetical protein